MGSKLKYLIIGFLWLCFSNGNVYSQKASTRTSLDSTAAHSPKKATIYSAVLPGLGQAYNKKYWKIPIVYAGFGTTGYFIYRNTTQYKLYKQAYIYRMDDDYLTVDDYPEYTATELAYIKDNYRRNMEISYIATAAVYIFNIIDATVDAHLFDFDISDDLSMNWQPSIIPLSTFNTRQAYGLSLRFSLH